MMLPVNIRGKGMIPRMGCLAPKNGVRADLNLIRLLLATRGLNLEYINPDTGKPIPVTRDNYMKLYKAYNAKTKSTTDKVTPVINEEVKPVVTPPAPVAVEETTTTMVTSSNLVVDSNPVTSEVTVTPTEIVDEVKIDDTLETKAADVPSDTPVEDKKKDYSFKPVYQDNNNKNNHNKYNNKK